MSKNDYKKIQDATPFSKSGILTAEFEKSVNRSSDIPNDSRAEFCIVGRSNVGKSSFLNHVLSSRDLARVSKRPGTTQCANLFVLNDRSRWIDLPGYGFAFAPHDATNQWAGLIDDVCMARPALKGILWLLDVRHPGMKQDIQAYEWLMQRELPVLPIITKCDTLTNNKVRQQLKLFYDFFTFDQSPVLSSVKTNDSRMAFYKTYTLWRKKTG